MFSFALLADNYYLLNEAELETYKFCNSFLNLRKLGKPIKKIMKPPTILTPVTPDSKPARTIWCRRLLALMLGVVAMMFWQGCNSTSRPLTVTTDPAGATVSIDSHVVGTTPYMSKDRVQWSLKDMPHHQVEVKLTDY